MTSSRMVFVACVLVSGVLLACGGGGDGDKDAYVAALKTGLLQREDLPLTDEEAGCVSEGVIDVIGADELDEAGVKPEDIAEQSGSGSLTDAGIELREGQGREIGEQFADCLDLADLLVKLSEQAANADLGDAFAACIGEHLDEQVMVDLLALSFAEVEDAEESQRVAAELADLTRACPTGPISSTTTSGPTSTTTTVG